MYAVMFKKMTDSAWGFSNLLSEADAEHAAAYRRCGYDAVHVALPT